MRMELSGQKKRHVAQKEYFSHARLAGFTATSDAEHLFLKPPLQKDGSQKTKQLTFTQTLHMISIVKPGESYLNEFSFE